MKATQHRDHSVTLHLSDEEFALLWDFLTSQWLFFQRRVRDAKDVYLAKAYAREAEKVRTLREGIFSGIKESWWVPDV